MLAEADNSIEENVFHEIGHLHSLLDLLRHLLLHKLLDQLLYRLQAVRYVNHITTFVFSRLENSDILGNQQLLGELQCNSF